MGERTQRCAGREASPDLMAAPDKTRARRPVARWPFIAGAAALAWLLLRSGRKPNRITYPCQQAALSTASLVFSVPVVAALVAVRRRIAARRIGPLAAFGALALLVVLGMSVHSYDADAALEILAPGDYRAQIFHVTNCPQDPVGDHFLGLDDLIELMGAQGLKFYKSTVASLTAGPEGVVGVNDVVLVKINYQWPQRGGTNTDLLRGLIRRIVDHPDGFSGEIVVVENAQFNSTEGFDRAENNAQDHQLSPHDVVAHFQTLGFRISHYDWTAVRYAQVAEYSASDMRDGYVVGAYDSQLTGRPSYPKFQTTYGAKISTRYGIWTDGAGYDKTRLKFINVPVLKSHHSTYGATAAVKHYMGVVTRELSTNSHGGIGSGLLGAVIGDVGLADLNILDAIWINANPNSGPQTTYAGATRRDQLVASRDPVALDRWAVKNILIPAFIASGYSPPWPTPSADPDDSNSAFRRYLDASMREILERGHDVTNDYAKMDLFATLPPGEPSDPAGAGAPFTIQKAAGGFDLAWSAPPRGGPVSAYNLYRLDLTAPAGAVRPICEAPLGGGLSAWLPTLTDDHGFLVVGRGADGEGSFGEDGEGHERPSPGTGAACP